MSSLEQNERRESNEHQRSCCLSADFPPSGPHTALRKEETVRRPVGGLGGRSGEEGLRVHVGESLLGRLLVIRSPSFGSLIVRLFFGLRACLCDRLDVVVLPGQGEGVDCVVGLEERMSGWRGRRSWSSDVAPLLVSAFLSSLGFGSSWGRTKALS